VKGICSGDEYIEGIYTIKLKHELTLDYEKCRVFSLANTTPTTKNSSMRGEREWKITERKTAEKENCFKEWYLRYASKNKNVIMWNKKFTKTLKFLQGIWYPWESLRNFFDHRKCALFCLILSGDLCFNFEGIHSSWHNDLWPWSIIIILYWL
jgi:hypothetical protein